MNINFKQPKYIIPVLFLPFLLLFFFVYHSEFVTMKTGAEQQAGINGTVGDVSADIKKKRLADKLDAFRSTYKEGDGITAVNSLPGERSSNPSYNDTYSDREKRMLDSINMAMKEKYGRKENKQAPSRVGPNANASDLAMTEALKGLSNRQPVRHVTDHPMPPVREKDPMEMFRQQMAYVDSMNKTNDPAFKAEKLKKDALAKAEAARAKELTLPVHKAFQNPGDFNTVMPGKKDDFIKVVIDENLTGYVSSRIRLKLLDDIVAGKTVVRKDTYLYALISGFSGQRVTLTIRSIACEGKILPVRLEIYDLDGLPGLYVPESAFRDFTKDLSTNTIQGVNLENGSSAGSQFVMSTVDKIFESTSSAIAGMIRKNKAKIKYNSYLYLIDNDALQKAQTGGTL